MNSYLICRHCNFHNKIEDSQWVEDPLFPTYEDDEGNSWPGRMLYHCPNCDNDADYDGFPTSMVSKPFQSIEYFYRSWQSRKHKLIQHVVEYYNKEKGKDILIPEELAISFIKLTVKFEAPRDMILSNPANDEIMMYFKELLPTIDMDILSRSVFNLEPWEVYEEEAIIVIMAVSIFGSDSVRK